MYEQYYGLQEPPFQLTPDPRFLYMSASHQEAFAQFSLGLRMRRGFIVLSGEVGTGKTTLIRAIMQELEADTRVALIFHTLLSARGLLQNICNEYDLNVEGSASKSDYVMRLHEFLIDLHGQGGKAVLMIDEAHNLKEEILEEIRLLSNLETPESKLIQICLVGQPELLAMLAKPQLRQLNQRISLRYQLKNLNATETAEYIRHRLAVAGLQMLGDLFTREAVALVHKTTAGIPRKINIICENALVMGYVRGTRQIGADIIKAVAYEDTYQEIEGVMAKAQSVAIEKPQFASFSANDSHSEDSIYPDFKNEPSGQKDELPGPATTEDILNNPDSSNGTQKDSDFETVEPAARAFPNEREEALPYYQSAEGQAISPRFAQDSETDEGPFQAQRKQNRHQQAEGPVSKEFYHTLLNQLLRDCQDFIILKKPSLGKLTAFFLIGFLSYVIAILSAILILQYLQIL